MSQSIYPFDSSRENDSELSFDQFTFEELQDPQVEESSGGESLPDQREDDYIIDEYIPQYKREQEVEQEERKIPTQTPNQLIQSRLRLVRKALSEMKEKIDKALELIEAELPTEVLEKRSEEIADITESLTLLASSAQQQGPNILREGAAGTDRVLEGVFDGQNMVGSDGNRYAIPQNYASKSKIVEGDALKLTITERGSFIYKQIGPVERIRVVGSLQHDRSNNTYYVKKDSKRWAVLSASVTYFHGNEGDEAVIIVPRDYTSSWGAVENIIKRT